MLLPSKSGYRDEKQRLMLTTDYDLTYKAIEDNELDYLDIISDFGVTVPIPEVLSASLYREDVHSKYFGHIDPPDPVRQQLPPAKPLSVASTQEQVKDPANKPISN